MIKDAVFAALELSEHRRTQRRAFLKNAATSSLAVGGLSLLTACDDDDGNVVSPAPSPTPTPTPGVAYTDGDLLNYALNLEYLEAQYYSIAALGRFLPETSLSGSVGTRGAVTGGRKVTFEDRGIASIAREIALDEIAHVELLRAAIGSTAIAQPALNIDGGATGAFTAAARAAGIVGATETFDPYASENNFLLGAYIFEDVGVTAYKGAARLLVSLDILETAAGILAAESYHAALIRTGLYARGRMTPSLRTGTNAISDARDRLDGSSDIDQGTVTQLSGGGTTANIVPSDANGVAFGRTPEQTHNIAYLRATAGVGGGFFPAGTNNRVESLRVSGANG